MSDYHLLLDALVAEKNGDWDKAHKLAQEVKTIEGFWVHAFLHRVEGDESNAQYWYNKAKKEFPKDSIEDEREKIIHFFKSKEN